MEILPRCLPDHARIVSVCLVGGPLCCFGPKRSENVRRASEIQACKVFMSEDSLRNKLCVPWHELYYRGRKAGLEQYLVDKPAGINC